MTSKKAVPLNAITLGLIRTLKYGFWGDTNIQSMAVLLYSNAGFILLFFFFFYLLCTMDIFSSLIKLISSILGKNIF